MMWSLGKVCTGLAAAGLMLGAASGLQAQVPITLFNGISLLGWNTHGGWTGSAGVLSAASGGTPDRSILTAVPFQDFSLSFDYQESQPMKARLRVWAPKDGGGGSYIDLDTTGQAAGLGGIEGGGASHIAGAAGVWRHVQVEAMQGRLTIHVDGQTGGMAGGTTTRAGYLGWELAGPGTFQVRSVKLMLLGMTPAFNGSDLSSWKSVAHSPKSKGGVGHDLEAVSTLGILHGGTKAHAAKWNVQNGSIHGEDGPGGLEYATPINDAIIQLTASTKSQVKPDHFTALNLRDTSGQLDGGYPVGVGPYSGSIQDLMKHAPAGNGVVDETIVIAGRTIAMWVGGNLYNVYTDSRPESTRVAQGARDAAGTLTFVIPGDGVNLNVQHVAITPLPKNYGSASPGPATMLATTTSSSGTGTPGTNSGGSSGGGSAGGGSGVSGGSGGGGTSATENALLQQQKLQQQQADADRQSKQRVASLMALALSTTDPSKQMELYNQVIQIDPSNVPAVQGYKDAQAKLQASQNAQDQQQATAVSQQHDALTKDQQVNASLVKAQSAFLAGHIAEAGAALTVAERLAPDNPLVRDLRSRINATSSLHSRIFYLSGGAGLLALVTAGALWFRRRKQAKFPMLEITDGLDAGEQFRVDKDLIRIGAVAQDGGQKNDIVVRDVDRMISRFHCEIARKNGQLYLTDLKSSNGTKLEGVPLLPGQPALLRRGNRILLANAVELRLGYATGSGKK